MNFHRPNWSLVGRAILGLALVAVGAVGGIAYADNYSRQVVAAPSVTMPLYGAGLGQPAAVDEDTPRRLKAIEEKLDRILKLLAELEDDKANPPVAAKPANALQAAAEVCARCHSAETFKTEGDGFAMFDEKGQFRDFSDRDIRKIVKQVSEGTMPPPKSIPKIREDERAALIEAFSPKK